MKKFLIVALLFLSACAGSGPLTPEQIASLRSDIQSYVAATCSFQPDAASLGALISAFYSPATPYVGMVNAIGNAICTAPVTAAALRRGTTQITRIVQTPKGPVAVHGTNYNGGALR